MSASSLNASIGVKPEASLLIVMASIYEKNVPKDEIQKLKQHVD
jgi:hypothetical protein